MTESLPTEFSIRVYGLFIESGKVLLADEYHFDREMIKFPGGGLEFGESTLDCLKREMQEEMNMEISILEHFYTTDFYQKASFNQKQLICIYYLAKFNSSIQLPLNQTPYEHLTRSNGSFSFRWQDILELDPQSLSYQADQKVGKLLQDWWLKQHQ